jgi:hypothetical protein
MVVLVPYTAEWLPEVSIEPDNVASVRCALSAGFTPDDPEPDGEGIAYYVRR